MVKVKKRINPELDVEKIMKDTTGKYETYTPTNLNIIQFQDIGDNIEGKFNGIKDGNYGDQIVLLVDNEECYLPSIVRFNTLLADLIVMEEEFSEVWVKIEYLGKKESTNGRMFKDFNIELKKVV